MFLLFLWLAGADVPTQYGPFRSGDACIYAGLHLAGEDDRFECIDARTGRVIDPIPDRLPR